MPASGKRDVMSEAEIEQRSKAGQAHSTHKVYAFMDRGESALEEPKRSRFAELSGIVQTRPGVLTLLQERCVQAVMICELLESYIVTEKQKGKALVDIPVLKQLPAFQNSAQRCINTLLQHMREDPTAIDAGKVLEAVKHGKEGDQTASDL